MVVVKTWWNNKLIRTLARIGNPRQLRVKLKHSLKVLREKRRDFRVKKRKKEAPNTKIAKFTADKKPEKRTRKRLTANRLAWNQSLEMAWLKASLFSRLF